MKYKHITKQSIGFKAFLQQGDTPIVSIGKLPHWEIDNRLQFVTFRQADSIPQSKLLEYKKEKEEWLSKQQRPLSDDAKIEYSVIFGDKIDKWLDAGIGSCVLKNNIAREILSTVILYDEGKKYDVLAACIMPNHVHLLLYVYQEERLKEIVQQIKRISAHKINTAIGRKGELWQKESFDRVIRSWQHLKYVMEYINHNGDKLPQDIYTTWENIYVYDNQQGR